MKPRTAVWLTVAILAACAMLACAATDTGITAKVKAKLTADEQIRAGEIEVQTHDGVVTLTGNLDDPAAKQRALEIARSTKGVTSVVDMIAARTGEEHGNAPEPDRSLGDRIDDAEITMSVKSHLLDDPAVAGLEIDVDTRDGVVYLTGTVRTEAERNKAVEIARGTEGVLDVQANLKLGTG